MLETNVVIFEANGVEQLRVVVKNEPGIDKRGIRINVIRPEEARDERFDCHILDLLKEIRPFLQ